MGQIGHGHVLVGYLIKAKTFSANSWWLSSSLSPAQHWEIKIFVLKDTRRKERGRKPWSSVEQPSQSGSCIKGDGERTQCVFPLWRHYPSILSLTVEGVTRAAWRHLLALCYLVSPNDPLYCQGKTWNKPQRLLLLKAKTLPWGLRISNR